MKEVILKTPWGNEFTVVGSEFDDSVINSIEASHGYYEYHVMELLRKIVGNSSCCLDIGANIGVISLCLSVLNPDGKVYAFEPGKTNYEYMQANIERNQRANIIPVNLGISDRDCVVEYCYVERVAACSFVATTGVREGVCEQIQCTSVDQFCKANAIARVDTIKLDVEGGEVKAILGAIETIRAAKPALVVEFNPNPMKRFYDTDARELYDLLRDEFSQLFLIKDDGSGLARISSYTQLLDLVEQGKGWEDLYCVCD